MASGERLTSLVSHQSRFVFDPNVLVSAVITPPGVAGELLCCIRREEAELVICPALLIELAGVIERPKFRRWITLAEAARFCRDLAELATMVEDPTDVPKVSRDPTDDYLFALGHAQHVDALTSGDPDVLEAPQDALVVLSPRATLRLIRGLSELEE